MVNCRDLIAVHLLDSAGYSSLAPSLATIRHFVPSLYVLAHTNRRNLIHFLLQNLQNVLFKRLKVQGLYVDDYDHKYLDEFYREVPPLVASGQLKYTETIVRSLEEAGQLILDVQKGNNRGKVSLRTDCCVTS